MQKVGKKYPTYTMTQEEEQEIRSQHGGALPILKNSTVIIILKNGKTKILKWDEKAETF